MNFLLNVTIKKMLSSSFVVLTWIAHALSCMPMPNEFIRLHFSPCKIADTELGHFECWNIYSCYTI